RTGARPSPPQGGLEALRPGADPGTVVRDADIPFVAWPERARERVPACLFIGSTALHDAIAARLIAATAARLPDVTFELVGPACEALGPVPATVRLHGRADADLFRRVRLGLSPVVEVPGRRDRGVGFARAGLPGSGSPAAPRGLERALTDCW